MRIRTICTLLAVTVAGATAVPAFGAGASTKGGSSGCGREARPGSTTLHLLVDGTDREYVVSVPDGYDRSEPAPLLLNFHGLGSNMQQQAIYSNLDASGGARGYVVVTPNGEGDTVRHWSLRPSSSNPDAVFVQAILRAIKRALCIDGMRVFATGMSNGAMFSTLLACSLPGRLAAIAPVAGVNATVVCTHGTPRVSVLAFHGTADDVVPYDGGAYFSGAAEGRILGVPPAKRVDDAVAAWAAFDGCGTPPSTSSVVDDVQHLVWPHCRAGRAVELYRVVGGGHTWPGAIVLRSERLGSTTGSISATALMLDFFAAHPRPR